MRKTIVAIILSTCIALLMTGNAFAAWSFDITTDYALGDPELTFELNLNTDETLAVRSYGIEFIYDNSELTFVNSTNNPLAGLFPNMLGALSADQSEGTLNNFNAASFSDTTVNAGTYTLGTFTFDVTNPVLDEMADFNFDFSDPMLGYIVNGTSYAIQGGADPGLYATSHFTDVGAAVPVPSAIMLMGTGLLALIGFRRRNE